MKFALLDQELLLLDQHRDELSENARALVDEAKARVLYIDKVKSLGFTGDEELQKVCDLLSRIAKEARTSGKMYPRHLYVRYCPICRVSAGYRKYTRNSRHHNKGDNNLDKPLTMSGLEFASRFVTIKHSVNVGGCMVCMTKLKPLILEVLAEIPCEVCEHYTGRPKMWLSLPERVCRCGWVGSERDMPRERTILSGTDTYPAYCPACNAKNTMFDTPVKLTGNFTVEKVESVEE